MDALIQLIIYIVVFAIVAYGLVWVCDSFGLPQPIKWICGAILLIAVLLFLGRELGSGGASVLPRLR